MTEINAISAISGPASEVQVTLSNIGQNTATQETASAAGPADQGFETMLTEAISTLDGKVAEADRMVAKFAVDSSTPIHHVTVALEEARMAVELATQVRQRLTEGYRQLMNMQL